MSSVTLLCGVLLILALGGFTSGQVDFEKPCPVMPPITNFNLTQFGGHWYEHARYDYPFVAGGECVTMNFEITDKKAKVESTLRRKDKDGNLKLPEKFNLIAEFQLPSIGNFNLSHAALNTKNEYRILATDYHNYALVWRCDQVNSRLSRENAWLLTRARQLTGTINQTIEGYINAVLSPSQLHRTMQDEENCTSSAAAVAVKIMGPVAIVWVITLLGIF